MVEGVTFHREELESFSPGFYAGKNRAQYFCLSEFLVEHGLPATLEFIHCVLDEVMREFPGITIIEFVDQAGEGDMREDL